LVNGWYWAEKLLDVFKPGSKAPKEILFYLDIEMFKLLNVMLFIVFMFEVLKWDVWLVSTHFGISNYGLLIIYNSLGRKSNNSGMTFTFK
jgi:hypothetical protein